jgi:universal stress protein A
MREYRRLLAAIDLHDDSIPILERARDLAERYGAELSLIHVVEPLPADAMSEVVLPSAAGIEPELHDNAERRLRELSARLGLSEARRHVVVGYTKREILKLAQDHHIDLIIVGSHGRHGLALLLGSTANAVLHGAPCDVLAVRI